MRASRVIVGIAALAIAIAALPWINRGEPEQSQVFQPKTAEVGAIDIRIAPHHVDSTGVVFEVTMDTHTTDLNMSLAATLRVGKTTWAGSTWNGDPPSGHHRAGEFRFEATGFPSGVAAFTLSGFDEPVSASWVLGEQA